MRPPERAEPGYWCSATGEISKITALSDAHLTNILRKIASWFSRGSLSTRVAPYWHDKLWELLAEVERRNRLERKINATMSAPMEILQAKIQKSGVRCVLIHIHSSSQWSCELRTPAGASVSSAPCRSINQAVTAALALLDAKTSSAVDLQRFDELEAETDSTKVDDKAAVTAVVAMTSNPWQRYEYVQGTSNKFWEIRLDGTKYVTRWGRIGTDGSITTKEYHSEAEAQRQYRKIIAAKLAKGYSPV